MAYNPSPNSWREADIDDLVSEKQKQEDLYLMGNIDAAIHALVRPNKSFRTARDYYEGRRDEREFAAITDNFGIGNPGELPFIPLMRKHVQALRGQFLEHPLPHTITCTDEASMDTAQQEWVNYVIGNLGQRMVQAMQRRMQVVGSLAPDQAPPGQEAEQDSSDPFADHQLSKLQEDLDTFQSSLERYSAIVLKGLMNKFRLKDEFSQFVEDISVEARIFYRCWIEQSGQLPRFQIIKPDELHIARDKSLGDVRNHARVVHKTRFTRQEVLTRWGHELDPADREVIAGRNWSGDTHSNWIALQMGDERGDRLDKLSAEEREYNDQLVDVYHVEWIANNELFFDDEPADEDSGAFLPGTEESRQDRQLNQGVRETGKAQTRRDNKNKSRFRQDRYEGVRIGSSIYCAMGRSRYVQRSIDNPYECQLTYNGLDYGYSLMLQTKDLQDKSDILYYHLENLIANGGVPGVITDLNSIPIYLGKTKEERVMKFRALVKQGLLLVDPSQDGQDRAAGSRPAGEGFNNFGTFDTSFNGQSAAAIGNEIARIDEVGSRISGVPRQALADISDQDLVGTTNAAMAASTQVTRPMFAAVYRIVQQALTDMLNNTRLAASENPAALRMLLGEAGMRLFQFDAKRFALADHSVHVADAGEELKALEMLKGLSREMMASQMLEAEDVLEIVTATSLPEVKSKLRQSVRSKRAQVVQQLTAENEQLKKQLQQQDGGQQQTQQAQQQIEQAKVQGQLQIAAEANQINREKNAETAEFNQGKLELDRERVELEGKQIAFSNQSMEVTNE